MSRFFSCLTWYLRQLLPLIYRTYYGDEDGNIHFAVWRMWFGRCFAIDDVVVDPFATVDNEATNALESLLALVDDGDCDGDCWNCLLAD